MTSSERRRRRTRRRGNPVVMIFFTVALVIVIAVLSVAGYVLAVQARVPDISTLKPVQKGTTSVVYAADGSRLGYIQSDQYRTPVGWREMPRSLRAATIAIEDERYYHHGGVDYEGIVRAVYKNVSKGKTVQGGSTITQQLVRNTYISPEATLERKIREAKLANELEQRLTKNQILQRYLNSVSYGTVEGATMVGVEAASLTFFDKHARDLTLEQAALLAGLPQAPSQYNPFQNARAATVRRNEVIQKMQELGYITRRRAQQAYDTPLELKRGTRYRKIREPFFFDYVKQQLIEKYGVNTVRRGGLKVFTTINPQWQKQARTAIGGQLNQLGDPSSAIVSVDPKNGYIRAMASSGTYKGSQFNLAAQGRRQAGSSFKTFVLTTAIKQGINPNSTTYTSKPLDLNDPTYGRWKVQTYGNSYGGSMNLVRATLASDNTVYAQLILDVGPDKVAETAKEMGITTQLDGYPAEGLGGLRLGVSPLEMADAYATLASGGWHSKPIAIKKVEFPSGKTEELGKPERNRVFSDGVAYEVTKILKQNVQGGTGTRANIGCPAAGKTGTTDNFNDAWFVGFTPRLATAVWVGFPNAQVEMNSVHGIAVAGGTFPAAIWHDYMIVVNRDACGDFEQPQTPAEWQSFFGRYSTSGEDSGEDTGTDTTGNPYDNPDQDRQNQNNQGGNNGGGGGQTPPPTEDYNNGAYAPDPTGQLNDGNQGQR